MVNENVIITNEMGLHLRPAGEFAKTAAKYECGVLIRKGTKSVDGKKVVSILSANIKKGDKIRIFCDGDDEEAACERIQQFMKDNMYNLIGI